MKLARKLKAGLVIAILALVGIYAHFQMRGETVFSGTSITMSYRALALVVLAVAAIGAAVAGALLRDRSLRVGASEFSRPLEPPQEDGLVGFAAWINRAVVKETGARIALLEQLRNTNRQAMVGRLAAAIAHELGTPLSITSLHAELIEKTELPRSEVAQRAHVIFEQAHRMADIIRQLLDFSRLPAGQRMDIDLRQLVTSTLDLVSGMAKKADIEVVCDAGPTPVPVNIDNNKMQQALMNIVLNGIQAMPKGGRLRVRVESRWMQPPLSVSSAAGEYQCVSVEDEGVGIAPDHLRQLFEPFFTTKGVGEGTGLGLPVTHGIVAEHGGWIAVDSVEGRGSCFSILLPPASAATGHRNVAA